jgi:GAF domain-containing protein
MAPGHVPPQPRRPLGMMETRLQGGLGAMPVPTVVTERVHRPLSLRALARTTAHACGFARCSVLVCSDGLLVPLVSQLASGKRHEGLGPYELHEVPAFARAITERRPVLVRDAHRDGLPHEWTAVFGPAARLVVPLLCDAGLVGVMVLDSGTLLISRDRVRRARGLAPYLAAAIRSALSVTEMDNRLRTAETLLSVGRTIGSTLELQEVVRRITREVAKAVSADSAGVYLMTESEGVLRPFAAYHMPEKLLAAIRIQPVVVDDPRWLTPRASDDVPNDPAFQHPIFRQFPAQSLVLTPLKDGAGVIGMLVCVWWSARRRLSRNELRLVEGIAEHAATAIVNAQRYARAAAQVAIDEERTRVDNVLHDTVRRTLFSVALRIERCLRDGQPSSTLRAMVREIKQEVGLMMTQVNDVIPVEVRSLPRIGPVGSAK